ncbi:PilZ domain-containing protein [Sphingomonas immobilis]|uniref:PilZ domain-containing protein n=1 Tax=Sphingomonas immobilis TaxID=3063997 RepID=A0ABT9A076_9SPHN|nr:PilZ domain-containing protein [Sphingomonas sp. CA1-15]MDO7843235.1 PilZ domain-containing protein [Sphingomonas sp. CA1-15]
MSDPEAPEGRAANRVGVTIRAQVRAGTNKMTIDVTDLSRTGFQIETVHRLAPDSKVYLVIPGLSGLEATVKWNRKDLYGCAFVAPLHEAIFDSLVKLSDTR